MRDGTAYVQAGRRRGGGPEWSLRVQLRLPTSAGAVLSAVAAAEDLAALAIRLGQLQLVLAGDCGSPPSDMGDAAKFRRARAAADLDDRWCRLVHRALILIAVLLLAAALAALAVRGWLLRAVAARAGPRVARLWGYSHQPDGQA